MCVFCDIASGATPAQIVHEDSATVAFLDVRPLFHGHTLLIPRAHHETYADLPPEEIAAFFGMAQQLERAVRSAMEATGSFVAMNNVVSQSVPHLHLHLVPRVPKDGLRGFFWPRHRYESEVQMAEVAALIRAELR